MQTITVSQSSHQRQPFSRLPDKRRLLKMRNKILIRLLMVTTLLILAVPVVASAQFYNRDRYDRSDRDVHDAIVRLDNSSARLESDLSYTRGRRVLGVFWVSNNDPNAIAEVR